VLSGTIARRFGRREAERARPTSPALADAATSASWQEVQTLVGTVGRSSPTYVRNLSALATFGLGNYSAAAADLETLFAANPKDADLAFLLGWAFASTGDDRRAATAWRNAALLDPSMVSAYLAAADAYLRLQQPALALQVLKTGLAAIPGSVELGSRLTELESR